MKPRPENIERGQYWDETWNPYIGCTPCSPGCDNCWAQRVEDTRFRHLGRCCDPCKGDDVQLGYDSKDGLQHWIPPERPAPYFSRGPVIQTNEWDKPCKNKKPCVYFAGFRTDLFHDDITTEQIYLLFRLMLDQPRHTFIVVTKRIKRAEEVMGFKNPVPNVIFLATVCNQAELDAAMPHIQKLHGMGHRVGLSVEPMLGEIDLNKYFFSGLLNKEHYPFPEVSESARTKYIDLLDWVIVGGESGKNARPMHPDWVRSLRDQCVAANVPFWFKQWGEWAPVHELRAGEIGIKGKQWHNFDPDTSVCRVGKKQAGRELDGRTWNEWPEVKK